MRTQHERRQFWRTVFHSSVRVTNHGGASYAQLVDISLRGALIEVAPDWAGKAGDECLLQLDLAVDMAISMWTHVTHVDDRHVGMHCTSIDLESITHLRRLVELNAGDSALLERELSALLLG